MVGWRAIVVSLELFFDLKYISAVQITGVGQETETIY